MKILVQGSARWLDREYDTNKDDVVAIYFTPAERKMLAEVLEADGAVFCRWPEGSTSDERRHKLAEWVDSFAAECKTENSDS